MSANLQGLREAITQAHEDRDECLRFFRRIIRGLHQAPLLEMFARLEADVHELDLLRKRELALLVHGTEAAGVPTKHTKEHEKMNETEVAA